MPLTSENGERYVAHVMLLPMRGRCSSDARTSAVSVLFVHKVALDTGVPPSVIAMALKVTPRELRVLLTIVETGRTSKTAEALGISETTVKTQLQRLYAKTGTSRQADVVKLVASYSNPLFG